MNFVEDCIGSVSCKTEQANDQAEDKEMRKAMSKTTVTSMGSSL